MSELAGAGSTAAGSTAAGSTEAGLTGAETTLAVDRTINTVGGMWMLHPDIAKHASEHGYPKPFVFYFAGRAGVLGDVDASIAISAMGYFNPGLVTHQWAKAAAVATPTQAATWYAAACADWGIHHFSSIAWPEDKSITLDRMIELGERIIAAVDGSALPLFVGWRNQPRVDGGLGQLAQVVHVLREWRGGAHLVATTAAGLSPLEAILAKDGTDRASMFGWREEYPPYEHLRQRHQEAEENTDRLTAPVYERALTPAERAEFAAGIAIIGSAVLS